eukprot:CAMPEP_0170494894 /NCGR_PEP_ID=MMETSP0208-20121228/14898_1 /TAXON_ID=197538 /ORGANISM="Strombidium inclinatum, Strain S3" /LENGTH=181 /DNA_ID=CAMNT_0010771009 /DNA_START=1723 /DNA_END=2268 /DNA_ORIENTATION=+
MVLFNQDFGYDGKLLDDCEVERHEPLIYESGSLQQTRLQFHQHVDELRAVVDNSDMEGVAPLIVTEENFGLVLDWPVWIQEFLGLRLNPVFDGLKQREVGVILPLPEVHPSVLLQDFRVHGCKVLAFVGGHLVRQGREHLAVLGVVEMLGVRQKDLVLPVVADVEVHLVVFILDYQHLLRR